MSRSAQINETTSISEPPSVCHFLDSLGIDPAEIEVLAIETGWQKEPPKKITPTRLIAALCQESVDGTPSYNDLASALDHSSKKLPSKQAVGERMNGPCLELITHLLQRAIEKRVTSEASQDHRNLFSAFDRVLVQDSTIIKLPSWLFEEFSGVSNAHSKVCNARIQATYDLKHMCFVAFSIDPYCKNDSSSAPELELRKNDLVLRDRGYLSMAEIRRHIEVGADFINRHKTGTVYLDVETGEPLDLLKTLRKKGRIDREVILADKPGTRVRLVAAPVDRAIGDERRRKAKKDTKGHDPSRAVLDLMDWTIYTTSLPERVDFKQLLAIYGLRWRIEVIFKAWKSHMNFQVIHRVSALELRICLTASLVTITLGTGHLYRLCHAKILEHTGRDLSLLKFSKYLAKDLKNVEEISQWLVTGADQGAHVCQALVKYCCYDKRKRLNYHEKRRRIPTP